MFRLEDDDAWTGNAPEQPQDGTLELEDALREKL
jgi:hypothetical protein